MRRTAWWAMVSAGLAPVLLIGGWTWAAALQPAGYDPARDTISALAGLGAVDRAVMTIALAALGCCHLVTAAGLRPAATAGRVMLGLGGLATVLVAVFPVPRVGTSTAHSVVAFVALVSLGLWPALAWRRSPPMPWGLRPPVSIAAALVLLGLLVVFAAQLAGDGSRIGLTERLAAGAESVWPLIVVLTGRIRT